MKIIPRYFPEISISTFIKAIYFNKYMENDSIILLNSARSSIKFILTNIKSYYNKTFIVGYPCYSCFSITQSVIESENIPSPLDIHPFNFKLTNDIKIKIKEIDILIWINFFGFKYNDLLTEIRNKFPNLIIIEDCSHVDFRDYMLNPSIISQFSIFSFNFHKPIFVMGGSAILLNGESEINKILINKKNELPNEKVNISFFKKILISNVAYNKFLYSIIINITNKKRIRSFNPNFKSIEIKRMSNLQKKILNAQLQNYKINYFLKEATKNYCNLLGLDYEYQTFGSVFYFPLKNNYLITKNVDKFILWENLIKNYEYFKIKINRNSFPFTFKFLDEFVFYPAVCFYKKMLSTKQEI